MQVDKPFPRVCGGVSQEKETLESRIYLFPAYAGVFPKKYVIIEVSSFPRVCGGVSSANSLVNMKTPSLENNVYSCVHREKLV